MADFSYTGSGGIKLGGCAGVRVSEAYIIKFPVGGIFYNLKAARRGCLEAIAIKRYQLVRTKKTFGQVVILYIDTFNGMWNEDELCSKAEAVEAAQVFYEWQIAQIAAAKNACLI